MSFIARKITTVLIALAWSAAAKPVMEMIWATLLNHHSLDVPTTRVAVVAAATATATASAPAAPEITLFPNDMLEMKIPTNYLAEAPTTTTGSLAIASGFPDDHGTIGGGFVANPPWTPFAKLPANLSPNFWERDYSPAMTYDEKEYLGYEFLHCGKWKNGGDTDIWKDEMSCSYVSGTVAPDSEVHLALPGTHTLVGTCFLKPGQVSLLHEGEDPAYAGKWRVQTTHHFEKTGNGLCEYGDMPAPVQMVKVSNCRAAGVGACRRPDGPY